MIFIPTQNKKDASTSSSLAIGNKIRSYAFIAFAASAILLATNAGSTILAIQPGEIKGLHYQLTNPSIFKHLSTQWNSFSRIDVTKQMNYYNNGDADNTGRSKTLAQIAIDADADTQVFRWNGSNSDLQWLKNFMDYMPYEISSANNNSTLVIGGGGGEDVLVALAGGSKSVTAVELESTHSIGSKTFWRKFGRKFVRPKGCSSIHRRWKTVYRLYEFKV